MKGLNNAGFFDLILVDDFSREDKTPNYQDKRYTALVHRNDLAAWLDREQASVQYVFHLGARTDTTEFDAEIHRELNYEYSQMVWGKCVEYGLPLVYASSAATYGDGSHGFVDDESNLDHLMPLNPYGHSKHNFDKWVMQQSKKPFQWVGLKFFNVYGPNEYHKGRMASVVFHAHEQIRRTKGMKLFRSHRVDYQDGEQLRDFIYVQDVVEVCLWLMQNRRVSGLFNLGTGIARSFNDLAKAVFSAMDLPVNIQYIDTPEDIREKYQYFTQADMNKLRKAGYEVPFTSLEDGVREYVASFLLHKTYI